MADVDKLLSELLSSDEESEDGDTVAVIEAPNVFAPAGIEDSQALVDSATDLSDLLPLSLASEANDAQQLASDMTQSASLLPAEVLVADQPQSQAQKKPLDPFAPSASALPEIVLQQSSILPKTSAIPHVHPGNAETSTVNVLDEDMAGVDSLLFSNQLSAGTPVASPQAAPTAETDSGSHGLPNSQADLPQNSTASEGLDALSADDDDFAENINFAAADENPLHATVSASDPSLSGGKSNKQQQQEVQPHVGSEHLDLPFLQASTADMSTPSEALTADAQAPPPNSKPLLADTFQSNSPSTQASDTESDADLASAIPRALVADILTQASSIGEEHQEQPEGTADEVQAEMTKPDAVVKPHEAAMARAEEAERRLLTDKSLAASHAKEDPAEALMSRLQWGAADWPEGGRADSRGWLLGGQVMMRLDVVNAFQEFFAQGTSMGTSLGSSRAVAAFRGVVAVGTSSGISGVLMPRGLSTDGHPSGQARVVQLGDARADGAVSCMAFSLLGNILLVGHATGEINLWEFKRTGWEAVKAIKDAHASAVTSAAFLESSSQLAISGDAKGRLVLHNVTAYLSITSIFAGRLSRSSQAVMLLDGQQLGPVCRLLPLPVPRPARHTDAGDPAHAPSPQEGAVVHEGLFLAATLGGMLVARAAPDGRFTVLHNLARPPDAREGCLPYPAWQPRPPASMPASTTKPAPSATLLLAWERKVYLMDVPLAGQSGATPPDPSLTASRGPAAPPPARLTKSWECDHVVVGVSWLNEQALAVISEQGPRSHVHLYDASGIAVRERLIFEDSLVGAQYIVNSQGIPEQSCHTALALTPDRMLLLGSQGVRSARLLTWQERLAALRDLLLWDHALWLGLHIYTLACPSAAKGGSTRPAGTVARADWEEEGQRADPVALAGALVALLLGYLDAALPQVSADQSNANSTVAEEDMQAASAADTAVELCILIQRPDVLWEEVYPRFLACAQQGTLLEQLLPHILASKLPSFPPEIMQALVEHFSQKGQPEAVERAVLHMDIASLDLNQVIRLCWRYGLLTALTYILNRGLNDYIGPAAALFVPLLQPSASSRDSSSSSSKAGYRLLVYLRCCLTGQSFPPGSGSLPEALAPLVKAQLLAFLIYTTPALLQEQLQGAGQAPGQAQDGPDHQHASDIAKALPGSCPVLRRLASFDPGAVLGVLQQSLAGWEALETDLLEAANLTQQAAELSEHVRSATQVVVDAVLDLLDGGVFRHSEVHPGDSTAEVLLFITGLLVEGRATADAAATLKVLGHLAEEPQPGSQDAFVAVLQTATLQGNDMEEALHIAERAGFQQAVARGHYLAGNFLQALHCAIHATSTPGAAFKYIRDILDEAQMSQERSEAFRAAVLGSIADLAGNEPVEAARLILERFPEDHAHVVASLSAQPELQFKYLQAATEVSKANKAVESEIRGSDEGLGDRPGVRSGVHDDLLAQPAVCEQFVALLCQFQPAGVLPFLQSHDSYRVEACLPCCQQYGVNDAQAYLLERLGDIAAAIKLYVHDIEQCNATLIQGVLEGDVQLPNVTTASGRLRSYAGSASLFSYSSGHTLLERLPSSPRAAGQQALHAAQAPLVASHQALQSAVALCQRHSFEASQHTAQQLWFEVLQCYVQRLRQIRHDAQHSGHDFQPALLSGPQVSGEADWSLLSPSGAQQSVNPSLALHLRQTRSGHNAPAMATTDGERWAALQQVFTGFMEEVITGMAGYIPLKAIGQRILAQYSRQQFGDFRGTLLGLLSAYSYESSILNTASRLMGSDAFRSLFTLYQSQTKVSSHIQLISPGLMTDSEELHGEGADHKPYPMLPAVQSGQTSPIRHKNGGEMALNLAPAAELSNASQPLGHEGLMSDSPAYRSGVDINFLRHHDI